ncbi:perosamine synthetase [Azonexus fungiphilus]|uniref:Perosamine synthetase n=1 Tax=Azonexus fungiphilus TaxID=146940 RepID=A0A495WFZ8_9RHOO|nr:DegT/DnrJ/EryC1/StrS aminotransferase family protein [Azonexus fungiphilus]RKT59643.1 perosamine synthetase [Azonexus fungiphilus]
MQVPVSRPQVSPQEVDFVNQALRENAVSGVYGQFIERFEAEFAAFCDVKHAVSCSNGTTALHLALAAAGIKAGDEILVSTLTNMASFFAVLYCGAKPIPVDIDPDTLTMDPEDLRRKLTPQSRGIMVVHLFGHPTDMDSVDEIARANNLIVFEDCAEAHGALYKGRKVGGLSHASGFSFFANKVLTTGEGGMLTTNDPAIAAKARSLKALAFGTHNKFMHEDIGFNYRMTNLQAALGCGQMLRAEALVERRREIARFYTAAFSNLSDHLILPGEKSWAKSVYWMYHVVLKEHLVLHRAAIMADLKAVGVETREGFIPYNLQKIFIDRGWTREEDCPNANKVAYASFYLPTGPDISQVELEYVVENFLSILKRYVR